MRLAFDLGFSVSIRQTVRLAGIDAPERFTVAGKAATEFLTGLIPPGSTVVARTEKADATDKYGRYLATLITTDGVDVSQTMIGAGHAVPYFGGARL